MIGSTRRRWLAALAPAMIGSASPAATREPRGSDWWPRWQRGELRGFTTANVPRIDADTLRALRETGAAIARIGVPLSRHGSRDGSRYRLATADAHALDATLAAATRLRLGVVVLGLFDDGVQPQPLWREPALQASFIATWGELAARIGASPALAGIDLLNEPNPTPAPLAPAQRTWQALATAALRAIRATGCRAPVVFEPVLGAHPSALAAATPLDDERIVYSIHFYTPHEITHQGVQPRWQRRIPYPAGAPYGLGAWDPMLGIGPIDRQRLAAELRFARDFAARHAVPIYVGEFGCVRWAPDASALRWVGDCLDLFAEANWSWTFHSFRTWSGWDAEIDSPDPDPDAPHARHEDAPLITRLKQALQAPPRWRRPG